MTAKFSAIFVTERHFYGVRWARNSEGYYKARHFVGNCQVNKKHLFCARLTLASGLPVLWRHGWGEAMAVGRVLSMRFEGKKLLGEMAIDDTTYSSLVAGGVESLKMGINSGVSCGFRFLDDKSFEVTEREGTLAKPDKIKYGRMELMEVSLTPMPKIADCGITGEVE